MASGSERRLPDSERPNMRGRPLQDTQRTLGRIESMPATGQERPQVGGAQSSLKAYDG
jgi:hypothetical protein